MLKIYVQTSFLCIYGITSTQHDLVSKCKSIGVLNKHTNMNNFSK